MRVLNLDNNKISGVLGAFIFYELDEIEIVYIRNNFLTEIGSFDFKRPKLASVFVDNNKIDDDGADEFFSDAIEYLSLDYNEITNFDFSDIHFDTLRHISLRFNEMNSFDLTLFDGYSWLKPLRVDIDHNSLQNVGVGNNNLACNESICSLYLWLLDNPPFYPTACRYQDGSEFTSLPHRLNTTRAGCSIQSSIAPLATNIIITQPLTQKPQVPSEDPHVHTVSALPQKPSTAASHFNFLFTQKPDRTSPTIESGSILCHIIQST